MREVPKPVQNLAQKPNLPPAVIDSLLAGFSDNEEKITDILSPEMLPRDAPPARVFMRVYWDFLKSLLEKGTAYCYVPRDTKEGWISVINSDNLVMDGDGRLETTLYKHKYEDISYPWDKIIRTDLEFLDLDGATWWRFFAWLPSGDIFMESDASLYALMQKIVNDCLVEPILEMVNV